MCTLLLGSCDNTVFFFISCLVSLAFLRRSTNMNLARVPRGFITNSADNKSHLLHVSVRSLWNETFLILFLNVSKKNL